MSDRQGISFIAYVDDLGDEAFKGVNLFHPIYIRIWSTISSSVFPSVENTRS